MTISCLKYSIFSAPLLLMVWVSFVVPIPVIAGLLGSLGFIGLFVLCGFGISRRYLSDIPWTFWWSTIVGVCLFLLGLSIAYVFVGVTPVVICVAACLLWLTGVWLRGTPRIGFQSVAFDWKKLSVLGIFGLQALLIYTIATKATTIALGTPWALFGPRFFVVYGITTALLLWYLFYARSSAWKHVAVFGHYLATFCVVAFVYKLGFGYDPFLHRAAEEQIMQTGMILPRTPFYIGQYVLVTLLAHVTSIPLFYIDAWLVPVMTALLLPPSVYYVLRYRMRVSARLSYVGSVLLLLFPLITFFVTTPHNFATLLTLLTFLLGAVCFCHRKFFVVLVALALYAFVVHPLSGMFALLFVCWQAFRMFGDYMPAYWKTVGTVFLSIVGLFAMPLLFFSYLFLQGVAIPSPSIIFSRLSVFVDLFQRPYYYHNDPSASLLLDVLYSYQFVIPVVFFVVGLFVWWKWFREENAPVFMVAFLLSNIFFLSTWVVISDLHTFEQVQYAQRLRHVLLFPLFSFALYGFVFLLKWLKEKQALLPIVIFAALALCLTGSFYLTYPQQNKKTWFRGYNVTSADMEAVRFIEADANGNSYVVLSNILTAAAAIDAFGFATYYDTEEGQLFYYAVPSGSPLAAAYRDLLYEGQPKSRIEDVFALTAVDRVYVSVSAFWSGYDNIIAGMKKHADSVHVIEDGAMQVFRYDR